MADFTKWGLDDADKAIADAVAAITRDGYDANKAFVEADDHWQEGKRWVGPQGTDATRATVLERVERQFTPRDAIGEVIDRVANALLKTEPAIDFVPVDLRPGAEPTEAQHNEAAAMVAKISDWWDGVQLWERARKAVKRSRWSGRGALRLWIAPGQLERAGDEDNQVLRLPAGLQFEDALQRLQLSAPAPDAAHVYTDPDTQRQVGVYLFERDKEKFAELWYVDGERTVLRVVSQSRGADGSEAEDVAEEYAVEMGGRLPIAEMAADLLITETVRRQQDRLNFFESLMVRVGESAGFPERYTTNAEKHGIWLTSAPTDEPALATKVFNGQTWYLHAVPRTLGSAITTDLIGIITDEKAGTRATPGVTFKEPTDPAYAIKASRHAYQTILEECNQAHILIAGDATASGVSRQEARADYEDDLSNTKTPLEGLIRVILEAVIAWAAAMSNDANAKTFLQRYRCSVDLHVNSGPITPEEMQQNNQNMKDGVLSQETAMSLNGVEDVAAELSRLHAQPESQLALRKEQIGIMQQLVLAGASWEAAAKVALVNDTELLAVFRELDAGRATEEARRVAEDEDVERALRGDQRTAA